ncbi:MAG: GGDEF domain-containing protein [Parvularculaceae bacterium]|nr:GGDEF domain-containing protein [Parvularculaceae bacterium]
MKVKGPGGPTPPQRPEGAAPSGRAAPSRAAAPVDVVAIAGIPESEMTPRVRAALTSLMVEVSTLRRELSAAKEQLVELEELARTDPLTGVLNRRAFVEELNRALAVVQRYGHPASLAFIDLDDLKKINDRFGHAAGDAALIHAAELIGANIRATDIFGRLGGDEFAIILTNTPKEAAAAKAGALVALVRESASPGEYGVAITAGVVEISPDLTAESALIAADRIMYEEKRRR